MKFKPIQISFIAAAMVLHLHSSAYACGFQATGVTKKNAKAVEVALQSITPEVEFDSKTGAIHFMSKEEVTQKQVDEALTKAGISNVQVTPVHHK